jgi:hypothetical protein
VRAPGNLRERNFPGGGMLVHIHATAAGDSNRDRFVPARFSVAENDPGARFGNAESSHCGKAGARSSGLPAGPMPAPAGALVQPLGRPLAAAFTALS